VGSTNQGRNGSQQDAILFHFVGATIQVGSIRASDFSDAAGTPRFLEPNLLLPTPYFGAFEADVEAEDFLFPAMNLAGGQVKALGDLNVMEIHGGVEAALGEDVDEDRDGDRIMKELVL
jgi:hypothetical protein